MCVQLQILAFFSGKIFVFGGFTCVWVLKNAFCVQVKYTASPGRISRNLDRREKVLCEQADQSAPAEEINE